MTEDIFVELLWKEVQQVQLFGKLSNQRRFAFLGILENGITSANLHNKLIGLQGKPNCNCNFCHQIHNIHILQQYN